MNFLTNLNLNQNELQNVKLQNLAMHPSNPVNGQIYFNTVSNTYMGFDGTEWINLGGSLSLGETSNTAFPGDKGKVAYDHSQSAHAPSNAQKNSDITKAEIEAKLVGTIATHGHNADKITAMTGYAKAEAVSAIDPEDSLNEAIGKLEKALDEKQAAGNYEPAFTKNTAFNKNFGTTSGTVAEGNHNHSTVYLGINAKAVDSDKVDGFHVDDTKTGADASTNNGLWTANKVKTELDKKSDVHDHPYDNYGGFNVKANEETTGTKIGSNGDVIIKGSGATTITRNGNTFTISSTDTNTDTKYTAGTGLQLSGTTFNHSNSVTAGTAKGDDSKTLQWGGTFTIPTVAYDANGHITSKGTTTMTMPANPITANDAMVFKGTLGTSGTVTALPTTYEVGWTYKVVTAGTYAGVNCEVGDMLIAVVKRSGSGNANSDWTIVQTNIDGAVTGPSSAVADRVATFSGTSGKVIKDSGFTIAKSVPANAVFTDTVYVHPSHTAKSSGLYKITVDSQGHVSAATAVVKSDITALGIPAQDTNTMRELATATTALTIGGTGAVGTSSKVAREDHTHTLPAPTWSQVTGKPTLINKYSVNIGNGSSTTIRVTHNLGTEDVTYSIREVSTKQMVITDCTIVDSNNIDFTFATAPTSGQYRVVVTG